MDYEITTTNRSWSVVMVIGLTLAHTAVNIAMNGADGKYSFTHFSVA